jgi:LPXTG-motif cell wall-anchored protein
MNKHTTSTGPSGFGWLRSLATFRHGNPLGRLVSMIAAFAIATLLVVGTGAAYADDTEPTPTDTSATADPTPDPAPDAGDDATPPTDDSSTSTDAPADSSVDAPADTSSDTSAPAPTRPGKPAGTMMTTLKTLAKVDVTPNLVGNADCIVGGNTMVGGFEIDADPCDDEGGIDFAGGPGVSVDDGYGDNGNWFTQGSSENDNPADWTLTGSSNTGKADIGTAWAFSHTWHADPQDNDPTDGHVFGYFGFTNDSTKGGTQDYSLEYDQAEPVNGKPVRTIGDLLFHFFANGSAPLDFEAAYIYTDEDDFVQGCVESGTLGAGWCPIVLPQGLTLDDVFTSAVSPSGEFAEGAIDITLLFGEGNCSGVFGTTFLRSAPGSFFTSELKDYVSPLDVTTPSTCGSVLITKVDVDTQDPVGGGVYMIDGDPRPGANPDDTLCIYDGPDSDLAQLQADHATELAGCDDLIADGTADGSISVNPVEPGSYTVTEIVPPPGYLLNPEPDPGNSVDVTVGEGESDVPAAFANHRKWQPLTISKTADGTFGATYNWAINKEIAPTADGPWSDGTDPNSPLVKNVEAGGDTSLYYRVVVTEEGVDTSAYVVKGTIHVGNPNDASVDATITESLTGCTLDSNDDAFPVDVSVPSGGADYAYTCNLGAGPEDPGTNHATVSWDKSTYPQSTDDLSDTGSNSLEATDGYTFTEASSVDKTITVTDDHFTFDPAWVITAGDEEDGTYESGVYSVDTKTPAGECSDVITNTASVLGDNDALLDQDSESGQVCVETDLTAGVSVDESLTRLFPWDIDKSTTTPDVTVANGQATAHYKVVVAALPFVDSNWAMSGTVTVNNPNDFVAEQVSTIDVTYDGGGTCSLDDPLPNVAASGSASVDFHCDFADEPSLDGTVTATVKWDGDSKQVPAQAAVTDAQWSKTFVDEFVKVFDDHAIPGNEDPLFGGTQLDWQDVFDSTDPAEHQVAVEYDYSFPASSLPTAGSCASFTNTAWVIGVVPEVVARSLAAPEGALASDDATVRVCTPAVIPPVVSPPEVIPPSLPNTGGPDAWLIAAGLFLVLAGGLVIAADRRRKHRS